MTQDSSNVLEEYPLTLGDIQKRVPPYFLVALGRNSPKGDFLLLIESLEGSRWKFIIKPEYLKYTNPDVIDKVLDSIVLEGLTALIKEDACRQ